MKTCLVSYRIKHASILRVFLDKFEDTNYKGVIRNCKSQDNDRNVLNATQKPKDWTTQIPLRHVTEWTAFL